MKWLKNLINKFKKYFFKLNEKIAEKQENKIFSCNKKKKKLSEHTYFYRYSLNLCYEV